MRLTALERLELRRCVAHPEAVAAFTMLRALTVDKVRLVEPLAEMVLAVSHLQQLTELRFMYCGATEPPGGMSPAAAEV
jgi:hypothetical protein